MGKLSFFYDKSSVYKISLRALQRRRFSVQQIDEVAGVIKAKSKKQLLRPAVNLHITIKEIAGQQTSVDIISSINKTWLTPDGYEAKAENRFINTLYKCFEKM